MRRVEHDLRDSAFPCGEEPTGLRAFEPAATAAASEPTITDRDGERTLCFEDGAVQSRMRIDAPADLVLGYTRLLMGFLLLHPRPERLGMIGLGGGSLARYVARRLPDADLTVVETSPAVIALREAFAVPPDGPRFRVCCGDGAAWIGRDGPPLDVLLIDGFDRDGQPEALCSAAFYDACRARLAPGGILAINVYTKDVQERGVLRRVRQVFDRRVVAIQADDTLNTIVFAAEAGVFPPPFAVLLERLRACAPRHPIGLDGTMQKILRARDERPTGPARSRAPGRRARR